MRKIVMTVLAGGSLLCSSMVAEAGILTGIRTVGNGLNAKVEVAADASLTYVFYRKDATHWVLDLAKTEPGGVGPVLELGIPAATTVTTEKRQAGTLAITRLTVAVRPGVSMTVKPSADRKVLNLSFQSGMAPASTKEDDLLGDLDVPAKSDQAVAAKDDLDAILDAPVAAPAVAAVGKADLAGLEADLDTPVSTSVSAAKSAMDKEMDELKDAEPVVAKKSLVTQQAELVNELIPAVDPPIAVVAAAPVATSAGVDLGALTPDELGIASPEQEKSAPAARVEPVPIRKYEPQTPEVKSPVVETVKPANSTADSTVAAGSIVVDGGTVEILVDNFSTYKAFTLMDPTRFVIDFAGAKASLKTAAAKAKIPGVKAVRFSQYPDKVRIVFDLPKADLPAYKVEKLDTGVRVVFK